MKLTPKPVAAKLVLAAPATTALKVEASNLPSLIDAFLQEKAAGCAPRTFSNYSNELRPFSEWWQHHRQHYAHTLHVGVFDDFEKYLEGEYRNGHGQPASAYMRFRTTKRIRQLLTWAHDKGLVQAHIVNLCPPQQEPAVEEKVYPTADDLARLIRAATGDTRLRDAALVCFMVSTGARRFEVANAKLADLQFDTPAIDLDASHERHGGYVRFRQVKGDAKGHGGGRISVFDNVAGLLLKAYLRSAGRVPGQAGTIFGISDTTIHYIVRSLGERSGLGDIHPHAFRSALIDNWHDRNSDAGEAADIAMRLQVGHSLPRSNVSLRYVDTSNKAKLLRRLRQFHASPLLALDWDWTQWPVHVAVERALPKSFV